MPNITPFLWFVDDAEEAAEFYLSVFPNSEITQVSRYGDAGPGPAGTVMTISFTLDGNPFTALNGRSSDFAFNESVSFVVHCASQDEVDRYWDALTDGGEGIACGWLKDRFGMRWQIVPDEFMTLMTDSDPVRAQRAMRTMMQMIKLDINVLRAAMDDPAA